MKAEYDLAKMKSRKNPFQREKFDYTKGRENIFEDLTGEEISKKALEFQQKLNSQVSNTLDSAPI